MVIMDSRNRMEVTRVKVGKYDIPEMRIYPLLFEDTKKLYEHFKSEEAKDTLTVAQLLGHKSDKSGAFLRKLACLRAYGLIEKRGIKVTDVGKRLTYDPSEEERNRALKETILNIPLWKEFHSKWGANLPTSKFWVELTKITGLEAPDAQKVEEIVRKAYLDDIRYLKPENKLKGDVTGMGAEGEFDTSTAISPAEKYASVLKVLIEERAFNIAKDFINHIEAKSGAKKKKTEEEG